MLPCIVVGADDVGLGRVVTAGATDVLPTTTVRNDPELLVERVERAVTDAAGEYAGRDGALSASLPATVETVEPPLLVADAAGRVGHVNDALASLADVSGDDVLGERVGALARRGRLDDEDGDSLDAAVRALPESERDRRDLTVSFEDGTTAECRLRALPAGHAISGTVVTVRDVTAVAEHHRRLDALDDALRALAAATGRETVCATAVEVGAELLDLPLCGIWCHDEDAGRLQPVAATAPVHDELGGLPHVRQGDGLAWDAFAAGEPAAYEDLRTQEGLYDPETSVRSELVLPLGTRGLLLAGTLTPTEFERERVQVATAFAAAVTAALKRVERETRLREREARLAERRTRTADVTSILAEELRPSLRRATADLGAARTAVDGARLAPVEAALARASDAATGALDLVRQGERVTDPETVAVERAVERAWDCVETDDATLRSGALPVVEADADRLVELLERLFRDAVERAGPAVTVTVSALERSEDPTDRSVDHADDERSFGVVRGDGSTGFFVADDGPGFGESAPERTVTPSVASDGERPGVDLAVAREIATAHGWRLRATESADGGARVEVTGVELATDEPRGKH